MQRELSDRVSSLEPRTLGFRTESLLFILIVVCAAAARLVTIGQDSLWVDEGYTQAIIKLPLLHLLTVPYDNHPPGYYGLMKLWIGDGSATEAELRLPSAIASILTLLPAYLLARNLMGNAGALAALAVYALSFENLVYAADARSYALLGFYLMILLLALRMILVRALLSNRFRSTGTYAWIGIYILSAIAAVYTHNIGVVFVLLANALFVAEAIARQRDDWRRAMVFCIVLNIPVVLAWLPYALVIPGTVGSIGGWLQQPDPKTAITDLLALILPNWTGIVGAIASLAGIITGFALVASRRDDLFYTAIFLVLFFPLVVWIAGFAITPIYMERSLLPAQFGGALFIGAVVAFLRSTRLAAGVFLVSFIPYAVSAAAYLERSGQESLYGGHLVQNWKGLARSSPAPGGPNAIVMCEDFSYPVVRYYEHDADVFVLRSDERLVSMNDPAWLYLYGLPVSDRLAHFNDQLEKLDKDGQVTTMTWNELAHKYRTVRTVRPRIFCSSEFEDAVGRKLGQQGYSAAQDISQNGVVAEQFVRNN